jgi:prepilin-type N-terminal cleavage/methylation domain-containing protein
MANMEQGLMETKKTRRDAAGLTLVEVLVAIVIFAIFALGLLPLATGASLLRKQQQLIAESTNLAQIQLEETRRYWAPFEGATATPAVNYTPGLLPVFGETLKDCSLKITATQPQVLSGSLLTDPENVAVNASGIVNYAIRENLATTTTATNSCIYKDSNTAVNQSKPVRYIAQLFWGNLTADAPPNSTRRVVVRIYRALGAGATCTGAGCTPTCATTPANCLPTGATLQPALPVFTGDGSAVNYTAPLVVLTADVVEPKA